MKRKNFAQILEAAGIDIKREYSRLYKLFYRQKSQDMYGNYCSLKEHCAANFMNVPFRKTCLSLNDFDDCHNSHFEKKQSNVDLNYLISFCEYTYNLVWWLNWDTSLMDAEIYLQQVIKVIELVGYKMTERMTENGCVTIMIPKSPAAIAVSEIVPLSLSYKIIEYNHDALKGDINTKKAIILLLANELEPKKDELKKINRTLENNIFFLYNNMNIRHNNCKPNSKNYKEHTANMSSEELESWYDEIYQLSLLSFLELDNIERTKKIEDLKKNY
mgnify:CR=1 FL=1